MMTEQNMLQTRESTQREEIESFRSNKENINQINVQNTLPLKPPLQPRKKGILAHQNQNKTSLQKLTNIFYDQK